MSEFMPYPYRGPGGALMRFKKRKSRFTFQEVELLLSEVQKKRHILVGKSNLFIFISQSSILSESALKICKLCFAYVRDVS